MPRRILVVDDDPDVQQVLKRFLGEDAYEVSTVDDGDAAMRRLQRDPPDLVLLDLDMPRLNGLEVLRRISAAGIDVAVVVLSGHFDERAFELAINLGAKSYLHKPIDFKMLEATINRYLGQDEEG
jgi:two-component system OmpR family response regulator